MIKVFSIHKGGPLKITTYLYDFPTIEYKLYENYERHERRLIATSYKETELEVLKKTLESTLD
jgi:hypothetical protein